MNVEDSYAGSAWLILSQTRLYTRTKRKLFGHLLTESLKNKLFETK